MFHRTAWSYVPLADGGFVAYAGSSLRGPRGAAGNTFTVQEGYLDVASTVDGVQTVGWLQEQV